ncbi:hypothetical protein ACFW0H_01070 [Pseudomonas sp. CR3202]|uniref:hypothetical protein n=1 Tax=Pseudomonas sp. CR3202 TaxID=3351532 RepID=UPI003BEF6229
MRWLLGFESVGAPDFDQCSTTACESGQEAISVLGAKMNRSFYLARDGAMNKAQKLFVEWSLWISLWLASGAWVVVLIWGIESPYLADDHPLYGITKDVLALEGTVLVETAKVMGVLLWVWLCVFVRVGRKKEPVPLPPLG